MKQHTAHGRATRSTGRTMGARGFTMVELMIVVVVMGVLAAVATVRFARYASRSKTAEASHNVAKIYQGQMSRQFAAQERGETPSFANASPLPAAAPTRAKYRANVAQWEASTAWIAIRFSLNIPHYYQYASPGGDSAFTARAVGNLDGDGVYSTFERVGARLAGGELQSTALTITNELE